MKYFVWGSLIILYMILIFNSMTLIMLATIFLGAYKIGDIFWSIGKWVEQKYEESQS